MPDEASLRQTRRRTRDFVKDEDTTSDVPHELQRNQFIEADSQSAVTNGLHDTSDTNGDIRNGDDKSQINGSKKRKFSELGSRPRSISARPPSPPWKKFAADVPTQFIDNGKRRSGRVSHIHADCQSPSRKPDEKKQTPPPPRKLIRSESVIKIRLADRKRASLSAVPDSKPSPPVSQAKSGPTSKASRKSESGLNETEKPRRYVGWAYEIVSDQDPSKFMSAINEENVLKDDDRRSRSSRHKTKPVDSSPPKTKKAHSQKPHVRQEPLSPVKLRKSRSPSPSIIVPPRHPFHIPIPSPYFSLDALLDHFDVQEKERAQIAALDPAAVIEKPIEKPAQDPAQVALEEAATRARLLEASRPGGPLSRERCSVYLPDRQDEPPKQYGHSDHLAAHLQYLRTLVHRERARHIDTAKKLAHACLARWKEKQPQTEEEKLIQEIGYNRLIYQQLVRDVKRKWELVSLEMQRRRLIQWQQDQDLSRDRKMQKLLEDTTRMLDRRREGADLDTPVTGTDDDDHESGSDSSDDDDSSNGSDEVTSGSDDNDDNDDDNDDDDDMSSSGSEENVSNDGEAPAADDDLSPEALRAKYAAMPALALAESDADEDSDQDQSQVETPAEGDAMDLDDPHSKVELEEVDDVLMDDEDESTDMSDDMTSSEDELSRSEAESGEGDDEEGSLGLLGFLSNADRRQVEHVPETVQDNDTKESSVKDDQDTISSNDQHLHDPALLPASHGPESKLLSVASPEDDLSSQPTPAEDTTHEPTEVDSTTTIDANDVGASTTPIDDTHVGRDIKTKVPSLLRATLREYQHFGLDWLAKLYVNQTNGILADEMGLGKTIQTIALLAHLAEEHQVWGPHLIVVPTSVILNWEMEFKKFLPGFRVLSYYGSQEERAAKRKGWSNPDKVNVVITSYQLILKDLSSIRVPEWHYMILDEAHNIKNFQSQRYQAMIRLKTHARLLLTGTPLQNSIQELWSLLTFLTAGQDGQGMGDLDEFTQWFKRPVDEIFVDGKNKLGIEAQEVVSKLHHSLRPYILRRMKSQVEKQLPGKFEHTVFCRLSKRQRQLYDAFLGRADVKEKLRSGNAISVSQALMALRKVCNHPDLFEERPIVTSFTMRKPFSRMPRSVIADYEIKDLIVRKRLLGADGDHRSAMLDQDFNLLGHERHSKQVCLRTQRHRASMIMNHYHRQRADRLGSSAPTFDGRTIESALTCYNTTMDLDHQDRLLRHIRLSERRSFQVPIYGTELVECSTVYTKDRIPLLKSSLLQPRSFLFSELYYLPGMVLNTSKRAALLHSYVQKFAFVTPHVVAHDVISHTLTQPLIDAVREQLPTSEPDSFHEARVRLSIAFPDRRLLQYDCGKLQRLAILLRQLTSRGSRALIFTQMTSVLNILEQFLNIHGYRYLRLDGSTRIERRQEMMERFNRDTRLDVFILSSRSGGVGMNLTGADTVIFYDLDWNPQMDKQCQDRAHRIGQTRDVHIYKFVSEHTIEVNILKKSNQKRMLDEVVIQEGEFTTDVFDRGALLSSASGGDITATSAGAGAGAGPNGRNISDPRDSFEADDEAGAAVDRVLGLAANEDEKPSAASSLRGPGAKAQTMSGTKILAAAEEAIDVEAAVARTKEAHADDLDFGIDEKRKKKNAAAISSSTGSAGAGLAAQKSDANPGFAEGGADANEKADASENADADATAGPDTADGTTNQRPHVDEYMLRFAEFVLWEQPFVAPVDKKKSRLDRNGRDRSHRPKRR